MDNTSKIKVTVDNNKLVIEGIQFAANIPDDVADMIKNDSYIPNKRLWRRWIMSQTLRFDDTETNGRPTFNRNFMENKPYRYAWDTTLAEIKAIADMPADSTDRNTRMLFYNKDMVMEMLTEYRSKMMKYIGNLIEKYTNANKTKLNKKEKCILEKYHALVYTPDNDDAAVKIAPIIHFPNTKLSVVLRFGKYKFTPIKYPIGDAVMTADDFFAAIDSIRSRISNSRRYAKIADILTEFINACPMSRLGCSKKMAKPAAWQNAFIGAGAYYTMDNMIKFHNCHIRVDRKMLSTEESLVQLNEWTKRLQPNPCESKKYKYSKLYKTMRRFIRYNNFSVESITDI